jgi:hypothetical protein
MRANVFGACCSADTLQGVVGVEEMAIIIQCVTVEHASVLDAASSRTCEDCVLDLHSNDRSNVFAGTLSSEPDHIPSIN